MVDQDTDRMSLKLQDYQKQGPRSKSKPWFVDGVEKRYRTMTTYINMLLDTGLEPTNFDLWSPRGEPGAKTERSSG